MPEQGLRYNAGMSEAQEKPPIAAGEMAIAELMATCALDARNAAQSKFNCSLDGSFASIETLEEILAIQHAAIPRGWKRLLRKPLPPEAIQRSAFLWGGYLGEVFRERWGGEWSFAEEGPLAGSACLTIGSMVLSPPAKVGKRLENGAEDSVWSYAKILEKQMEERLAAGLPDLASPDSLDG